MGGERPRRPGHSALSLTKTWPTAAFCRVEIPLSAYYTCNQVIQSLLKGYGSIRPRTLTILSPCAPASSLTLPACPGGQFKWLFTNGDLVATPKIGEKSARQTAFEELPSSTQYQWHVHAGHIVQCGRSEPRHLPAYLPTCLHRTCRHRMSICMLHRYADEHHTQEEHIIVSCHAVEPWPAAHWPIDHSSRRPMIIITTRPPGSSPCPGGAQPSAASHTYAYMVHDTFPHLDSQPGSPDLKLALSVAPRASDLTDSDRPTSRN